MTKITDMEPDGDGRTVAEELRRISMSLKDKYGAGEAKALGRVIFENLKGWSPVDIAIKANEPLSGYIEGKIAGWWSACCMTNLYSIFSVLPIFTV